MRATTLDPVLRTEHLNAGSVGPAPNAANGPPMIRPYGGETALALQSHGMTSVFGSQPWAEALTATYGIHVQASALEANGASTAAILFSEIEDIRGHRVLSLPFSDYVDPLVEDPATWETLVAPLMEIGAPLRFRCLRSSLAANDPRFKLSGTALWHAVNLAREEAEIWTSLDGSARQNIRKAQRHDMTVRIGDTIDDVRTFYEMHCHVRKAKYRLFAQPFSFFEALHSAFTANDQIFVALAEANGTAVGGILFLVHNDTLYYKFNASTEAALRPNDLLVWNGILHGLKLGLVRLDFGLSDPSQPGLVRFKQKFATEERTISILQWTPPGYADPRAEEAARVLHRLTGILTSSETPDEVTRTAGDELYRFFC